MFSWVERHVSFFQALFFFLLAVCFNLRKTNITSIFSQKIKATTLTSLLKKLLRTLHLSQSKSVTNSDLPSGRRSPFPRTSLTRAWGTRMWTGPGPSTSNPAPPSSSSSTGERFRRRKTESPTYSLRKNEMERNCLMKWSSNPLSNAIL